MRLGTRLLSASFLGLGALQAPAQTLPRQAAPLPWVDAIAPGWELVGEGKALSAPPPPDLPKEASLRMTLRPDGSLRVVDARGTVRASLGLPGRPLKAWRDGGHPLPLPGPWRFTDQSPLQARRVDALVGGPDGREGLAGLAWFLDDGEACVTVLHPATGGCLHLRLPEGEAFDLAFHPDHLELRDGGPVGPRTAPRRWTLAWVKLLPHLGKLMPPAHIFRGTALSPFPRE